MRDRFIMLIGLSLLWSCGGTASDPGPLVDNTKWVPTDKGEEFFGEPPEDWVCELDPQNCPEFPEDDCVDLTQHPNCVVSFVPECFDQFTVLAVYTRMPNDRLPLCNWLTLEQPSLRAIRAGDQVEVRTFHFQLTAPVPGKARMSFVIGDERVFYEEILIPSDSDFPSATWTAPKDYPAGTPMLFHVDNHGTNEYLLIEVNVL